MSRIKSHLYSYKGEVLKFGKPIGLFKAQTQAVSASQALNNLSFQAKQKLGLEPNTRISLEAKNLTKID